jgi:hypothetical protein
VGVLGAVLRLRDRVPMTQVSTWIDGFGFEIMGELELLEARSSQRMLLFPGSSILRKTLHAPDLLAMAVKSLLSSMVTSVARVQLLF